MSFILGGTNTTNSPQYGRANLSGILSRLEGPTLAADDDNLGGLFGTHKQKRIFFPPSLTAYNKPISGDNFGNRQYLVGGHSSPLVIDEMFRCHRQGMSAPPLKPQASVGAGSTQQILYHRWFDEVSGERSPLSDGLELTGNTTRAWINLPTQVQNELVIIEGTVNISLGVVTGAGVNSAANFGDLRPGDRIGEKGVGTRWARVRSVTSDVQLVIDDTTWAAAGIELEARTVRRPSHLELWVSVQGTLPRMAMRVRIGTASVTESTPVLSLGIAETESFEAMPNGTINCFYNNRQLMAGVDGHLDTIYLSLVDFPERHGGLRFRTKYNERIVGLLRFRNYVIVICPKSLYRLSGFTDDDYVMDVLEPKIGGIGHFCNGIDENRAYIPSQKGIILFNGATHQAIAKRRSEWQSEITSDPLAYAFAVAAVNPNDETFQLYPRVEYLSGDPDFHPGVYIGSYGGVGPQAGGAMTPPEWFNDDLLTAGGADITYASYMQLPGQSVGKLYIGDNNGGVWTESIEERIAYTGRAFIVTSHTLYSDPGGNKGGGTSEGWKVKRGWFYVKSENSGWMARIWPGDEWSYPRRYSQVPVGWPGGTLDIPTPRAWERSYAASLAFTTDGNGTTAVATPRSVWEFSAANSPTAGRGHTFEFIFTDPLAVEFYGLGWEVLPAKPQRRPVNSFPPEG